MKRETNPHENAKQAALHETKYSFLSTGRVSSAATQQSNGQHHAVVQESAAPSDKAIPVFPDVHGDYYIPPKDTPVVVASFGKNDYAVVRTGIPEVETPTLDPGERIVSHPLSDSHVRFNKDGSLDIHSTNEVRINGGTQGVITDVETTTSDGYLTSITLVREDSIKV